MRVQLTVICASLLVLSSFIGCSSYVDISFDEASRHPDKKIARVVFTKVISGVILQSGDTIYFDEQCGTYDVTKRDISGVTIDGQPKEIGLDRAKGVLLRRGTIHGSVTENVGVIEFVHSAKRRPWRAHYGRSVQPGKSAILGKSAGRFDPDSRSFTIVSMRGDTIVVEPEEVFFHTRKFDFGKTAMLTAAIAVGLVWLKIRKDFEDLVGVSK